MPKLLFDFADPRAVEAWHAIDDRVMGGQSRSCLRHDPSGHAVFEGVVSLERYGGFASVRSGPGECGQTAAAECLIELRGETRPVQLQPPQRRRLRQPELLGQRRPQGDRLADPAAPFGDISRQLPQTRCARCTDSRSGTYPPSRNDDRRASGQLLRPRHPADQPGLTRRCKPIAEGTAGAPLAGPIEGLYPRANKRRRQRQAGD